MIALVAGDVAQRGSDAVVIETASGIGYRVAVSTETLRSVPAAGGSVSLLTHLVVRDDALSLYGFATEVERDLFELLIGVQSVGPKMALAALSGGSVAELAAAIAAGDIARLVSVPGIGKRTAERIVVELKERIIEGALAIDGGPPEHGGDIRITRGDEPLAVAREGLVGLGFSIDEAERMLAGADPDADEPEQLIRQALKAART